MILLTSSSFFKYETPNCFNDSHLFHLRNDYKQNHRQFVDTGLKKSH